MKKQIVRVIGSARKDEIGAIIMKSLAGEMNCIQRRCTGSINCIRDSLESEPTASEFRQVAIKRLANSAKSVRGKAVISEPDRFAEATLHGGRVSEISDDHCLSAGIDSRARTPRQRLPR